MRSPSANPNAGADHRIPAPEPTPASLTAGRPPNLILIMTDNQGPWTLGCYGNDEIRTPNIDRLASEGVLFERAFCSNAVCSPNRATVLTGLMPSQFSTASPAKNPTPGSTPPAT